MNGGIAFGVSEVFRIIMPKKRAPNFRINIEGSNPNAQQPENYANQSLHWRLANTKREPTINK